jgi:hypothetical protein
LLDALDLYVGALVDFIQVLAKAVQKPADFFRDTCHGEEFVRLANVFARNAGAPAVEPVYEVPGLIRGDAASQAAQFLGAVDQLGALGVLCLCCAVEVLRIG